MLLPPHVPCALPPDTISIIADILQEDVVTLQRLSLVSSIFVIPCRRWLFRSITLKTLHSCRLMLHLFSSNKETACCVRNLRVLPEDTEYDSDTETWLCQDEGSLPSVVQLLSGLQSFTVECYTTIDWSQIPARISASLLEPLRSLFNLTELGFYNVINPPVIDICTFGQLKTLRLLACPFTLGRGLYPPALAKNSSPLTVRGKLDMLEIGRWENAYETDEGAMMSALHYPGSSLDISQLQGLSIHGQEDSLVRLVWTIMQKSALSLRTVIWRFDEVSWNNPQILPFGTWPIDFKIMRQLQFLVLRPNFFSGRRGNPLEWVIQALEGCCALEQLTVVLDDIQLLELHNTRCWGALDSTMGCRADGGSFKVKIIVPDFGDGVHASWVAERMPLLNAARLVEVYVRKDSIEDYFQRIS